MDKKSFGSLDLKPALDSIKQELANARAELKQEGQEAGEAVGRGWDDGLNSTVEKIKASSIKTQKAFNDLSGKIRKQVQQLTTNISGKDTKIKIDFSDVDINSDAIKKRVGQITKDFSTEGLIEFDTKGSEQQFKNLITLYVKYQEKLNSLQKTSPGLSAPKDIEGNLQQQLVLASKLKEIWSFLGFASPLKDYAIEVKNIRAQLEAVQKLTKQTQGGDTKVSGDYADLAKILKEIQGSLKIISDTFANENNSMKAMAENNVTSFTSWSQAIIEVYNNLTKVQGLVDTISKKDFNITNITNPAATSTSTSKRQTVKDLKAEVEAEMQHVKKLYEEMDALIAGLNSKRMSEGVFEAFGMMGNFDDGKGLHMSDVSYDSFEQTILGQMADAKTKSKIENLLVVIDGYIAKLTEVNKLREKYGLGEWQDPFAKTPQPSVQPTVQPHPQVAETPTITQPQNIVGTTNTEAQQMWQLKAAIDEVSNAIGRKNAGFVKEAEIVDQSVNAEKSKLQELINFIIDNVGKALDDIKGKLETSFTMPEINKGGLQESLDDIYNKFVELQKNIQALKINVDVETAVTPQETFIEANKQVTESAKASETAVKKEVEAAKAVAKDLAKIKEIRGNDGNVVQTDETRKFRTDKAVVTATESTRTKKDGTTNVTTTIIQDFEKLAKEADKSKEAVTRAQNKLNEFLTRFQSKSGGNAKFISGFSELEGTTVTADNIEDVFNQMMALQAEYSKLETNFRKGQSSLNPFVNAITKSENIGNIFGDVERQFNGLTNKSDELVNNFTKLQELAKKIQEFTRLMNSNPDSITTDKFSEFSKQVGEFNILKSQVEGSIKTEQKIETDNEQKRKKEVEEYIDLIKQMNEYEAKAAKGGNMQSIYDAKVAKLKETIIANDKLSLMNQEEKNKLLAIEEAHQLKIAEIKQKDVDKQFFKPQNDKLQGKFDAGYLSETKFGEWQNELVMYQSYLDGTVKADEATIQKKKASLTQLYDHLNKISNASRTFFASGGEILSTWFSPEQIADARNSLMGLYDNIVAERFDGLKTKITSLNPDLGRLTFTVDTGKGALEQYTIKMDGASGATKLLSGNTKEALTSVQQFGKALKTDVRGMFSAFIGGMSGMYAVGRYFKEGIQYVRELDKALTELKKVTDETEETYDRFLVTAGKTSTRIGSTLSNMTSATAEFAKLGYDIDMASSMAESALVYTNVGDNVDVETGSQSIISTMKAFGIEANNTMSIVDKFNEIGNNFAITTKGIGDALQVSASAMAAAGNTLDETIALTTAAM